MNTGNLYLQLIAVLLIIHLCVFPLILIYAVYYDVWLPKVLPSIFPFHYPWEVISQVHLMPRMSHVWTVVIFVIFFHVSLLAIRGKLHPRLASEVNRKSAHLYGLIIPALYYFGLRVGGSQQPVALTLCSAAFLFVMIFDIVRLRYPESAVTVAFNAYWAAHLRPAELKGPAASRWFFGGMALSMALFPPGVAVLAMLGLVLGDYMAAIVGLFAHTQGFAHPLPGVSNKSCEGSSGCVVMVALLVLGGGYSFPTALFAGVSAAVAEGYVMYIDDNFSIPTVIGGVLCVLGR